jgi:hypothetical protein
MIAKNGLVTQKKKSQIGEIHLKCHIGLLKQNRLQGDLYRKKEILEW